MNYKNMLINNKDWIYIEPNINQPIKIRVFDDGNKKYETFPNEWIKFGSWKGKIAIYNKANTNIIIYSISNWKTI